MAGKRNKPASKTARRGTPKNKQKRKKWITPIITPLITPIINIVAYIPTLTNKCIAMANNRYMSWHDKA